ncbi:MAG: 50S ribosomal protein L15 [Deltaproteobacteria bacterium]|nr:50S ribosomal protein L15 [Deltaproteobacteria bacterium]
MANELSNLKPRPGAHKKAKRIGRGFASGDGKTSGRGQKGQRARSKVAIWFEGGQMPLHRRLAKRGFTNIFAKQYTVVRLDKIAANFEAGAEVNATSLLENGIIDKVAKDGIKVLGNGDLDKALNITATKFTKSAKAKIEAAGGSAIIQ